MLNVGLVMHHFISPVIDRLWLLGHALNFHIPSAKLEGIRKIMQLFDNLLRKLGIFDSSRSIVGAGGSADEAAVLQPTVADDRSDWIECWAKYKETFEEELTITTAARLFKDFDDRDTVKASKRHHFEYQFAEVTHPAVLVENVGSAAEPVQALETEEGWIAKLKGNPANPKEYAFVYCTCGKSHL
jgi:hypothetical protein